MGSTGKSSLINQVTDNLDFNKWIKENMSNPEFKQFGKDNGMDDVKDLWRQKRTEQELKNLHEMSIEDAISQMTDAIPQHIRHMWFVEANSDIKPKLMDSILMNPNTLNAGMNIAYYNYKNDTEIKGGKPLSFKEWLTTPQTLYRGEHGQKHVESDIFSAYTPDINVAKKFGGNITSIKVRPIDTWGSYQTTAEQEFLVPRRKKK